MIEVSRRAMLAAGTIGVAGSMLVEPAAAAESAPAQGKSAKTTLTADQALERLREGNRRFVADAPAQPDISRARRLAIAKGQGPFAALVGCADSRVGPEHLFGVGLGDLFIVRTAGNYVDTAGLGSIEYAVAELGVPLIVVLGHERCGAVAAAASVVTDDAQFPGSIGSMVEPIVPAVIHARKTLKPGEDLVEAAVRANVVRVANKLRTASEPILLGPIRAGKVRVVGATYDLDTGAVAFIDGV